MSGIRNSPLANARFGANALGQQAGIWLRAFSPHPNRLWRLQIPAGRQAKELQNNLKVAKNEIV